MDTKSNRPTPYSDVNQILNLLFTSAREILKDQFVGMNLFGSLANGNFDKDSDIDVLVVRQDEISEKIFSALHAMHMGSQRSTLHGLPNWKSLTFHRTPFAASTQPTNSTHTLTEAAARACI
jgi:predicted nucleotidyltransferase